ncbi:MAG: glutamine--fructose-6-phosphate transaminase [Candidatus Angelobacter sp.]|nr:glutamine--fructose-6-phosphate transaminase [Candidatus Angelobacter sp.]
MCGIVGYIGKKPAVSVILQGLRRLEYRGYDSAGIAVAGNGHGMQVRRAAGKLHNLEAAVSLSPLDGSYGIGHTRWATHGRPSENNAHPHRDCSGRIAVVHNGIIENYTSLKKRGNRPAFPPRCAEEAAPDYKAETLMCECSFLLFV